MPHCLRKTKPCLLRIRNAKTNELMSTRHDSHSEDLNTLTEDAGDMAASTMDTASERFAGAREQFDDAMDQGKEVYENLREAAEKQAKAAGQFVRNNPYKAIGIAAGIAVLIGLMLRRRK
jgi:ElaB/YqjD/DUF883 family membrane-anchored ribosome-binding protein